MKLESHLAPKQNFGCQPPTLEGDEGGEGGSRGGLPPLLLRCTAVPNTSLGQGMGGRAAGVRPHHRHVGEVPLPERPRQTLMAGGEIHLKRVEVAGVSVQVVLLSVTGGRPLASRLSPYPCPALEPFPDISGGARRPGLCLMGGGEGSQGQIQWQLQATQQSGWRQLLAVGGAVAGGWGASKGMRQGAV